MQQSVVIIAGPTASGKSALALEIARQRGGVIINCDSMQIYDGLPILTAQPSSAEQQDIPHRLYGELPPDEICSAGMWREIAGALIADTLKNGATPIICGGTGFYIKALTEGLSPIPEIPDDIRKAATEKQKELGNPAFHEALKERDPEMASRLRPSDSARLIRAWEVLDATGKSLALWQAEARLAPPPHWHFEIHKVMPERDELVRRCDTRFLQMMKNGAMDEVEEFSARLDRGEIPADAPLIKALGFRPLRAYLKDEIPRDEAIALAQGETRRYAKRQVTWFRHQL
jgi:tRNA dimethylallyltransferase